MKRKIFISINIPDKVRKKLAKATQKWQDLPVKWTKVDNLHVTILFLGYVEQEIIPEICQKAKEVAEKENMFDLDFDQIELFPSADEPRMVALTGPASESLLKLHEALEKSLGIFMTSKKSFRPHIVLGRNRKYKWEALENKPSIEEKFPLILPVETIEVMASNFEDEENEYAVLESCPLK